MTSSLHVGLVIPFEISEYHRLKCPKKLDLSFVFYRIINPRSKTMCSSVMLSDVSSPKSTSRFQQSSSFPQKHRVIYFQIVKIIEQKI